MKQTEINTKWKTTYTWVLIANAVYIWIFYFLMKIFG